MRKEGFQEWVAWWRRLHVRKIREYSDAVILTDMSLQRRPVAFYIQKRISESPRVD